MEKPEEKAGISATKFDSELGWATIKNSKYVINGLKISTNSFGFRSPEIDPFKNHILVLGDSIAFGYGVSDHETFPYFLAKKIKNEYKNIQVLNMGVAGYGIDQYYLYLKRHIGNLKPKIIVILICSRNDLVDTSSESPYGKKKPFFVLERGGLKQITKDISYFNCENIFNKSWLLRRFPFASYKKSICNTRFHTIKQTTEIVKALIYKIEKLAFNHGSKVLFSTVPQRDVFILNYCRLRPGLTFCKEINHRFRTELFELIEQTKEIHHDKYAKVMADKLGGYTRGKHDYLEFKKIFRGTKYNHLDISFKLLESGVPIESFDDLFIDETHLSNKGASILAQFFLEYFDENHWLEP